MRLNSLYQDAIRNSFRKSFDSGEIYLFGSRIDDTKKGGDIDLYIVSTDKNKVRKKIKFLVNLKKIVGEQKIDVVLSYNKNSSIEQKARKEGILLCKL